MCSSPAPSSSASAISRQRCRGAASEDVRARLCASIQANGLVPNASTYSVMILNLLKEGSAEEADHMFSWREKSGCATTSLLLNDTMRKLLKKGEIVKYRNHLASGTNNSLEAPTSSLIMSLFSKKGKYWMACLYKVGPFFQHVPVLKLLVPYYHLTRLSNWFLHMMQFHALQHH
jgi:hypothetical protein